MKTRTQAFMTALCLAWAACGHGQTTIHVATTGSDESGEGTAGNPYLTISNGVAHAGDWDTVQVATGTYTVTTNIYLADAITVLGMDAPTGVVITTMYPDPASSSRCVRINSAGAVFAGMTVEKGYPPLNDLFGRGGGIYLEAGLVSNCVIRDCHLGVANGGGIYMAGADAMVADCTVVSNSVDYSGGVGIGGGVYMAADSTMLRTTVITNGNTGGFGAGVCVVGSRTRIEDCRILDNWGTAADYGYGAGLYLRGTNIVVNGCVISNNNTPATGAGIMTFFSNTAVTISGCTITHNRAGGIGGGVLCCGAGLVSNCWITCNQGHHGAGLANSPDTYIGLMTVTHSHVIANTNTGATVGGAGMYFRNHTGAVEYCEISGNYSSAQGGGIMMNNTDPNGNMTVRHCRITGNKTVNEGGGLYCLNGRTLIEHCEITSNYNTGGVKHGGGMYVTNMELTVRNCLFAGNRATSGYGGGMMLYPGRLIAIQSCTITDNSATNVGGGGVGISTYMSPGMVEIWNTVVSSNHVKAGMAEIYLPATMTNAFFYSCGPGLTNAAQGNITNAPVFAGYAAGNYRLAAGSPGVNAGTNQAAMVDDLDLDGRTRIDRFIRRVDMGCYEHVFQGAMFNVR